MGDENRITTGDYIDPSYKWGDATEEAFIEAIERVKELRSEREVLAELIYLEDTTIRVSLTGSITNKKEQLLRELNVEETLAATSQIQQLEEIGQYAVSPHKVAMTPERQVLLDEMSKYLDEGD
jgi:hypothetical protein